MDLLFTKPITKVRFSLLGDEDNEFDSYVSVEHFDMFKNNLPYDGGVYDAGLGTTDYSYKCNTCRNDKEICIGHEGHHRLNYPVKQPIFESDIIKWLSVICFTCGKPIFSDDKLKSFDPSNILKEAYNYTKTTCRKCHWCVYNQNAKLIAEKKGGFEVVDEMVDFINDDEINNDEMELLEVDEINNDEMEVDKINNELITEADSLNKLIKYKLSIIPIVLGGYSGIKFIGGSEPNEDIDMSNKSISIRGEKQDLNENIINSIKNLHPIIKRDRYNPYLYKAVYKEKETIIYEESLYPHTIAQIFNKISNETVISLGRDPLSHPKKLIISVIKIPPTVIRPDTRRLGGSKASNAGKSNELSTAIQYIVKKNLKIPQTFIPNDVKYLQSIEKLNEHYFEYVKGSSAANAKNAQAIIQQNKSLGNSLVGKKGFIRKNHLGKRVHKMIRSTITCNPALKINQVGIPIIFAKNIQIEEVLQPYNKDRLMVYFNNGRNKYPGCTMIKKKNIKEPFSIENIKDDFIFEYGDTIFRDMINGDPIYYNRQPSLHFSSIGCHEIVVNEDPRANTLEMNVIACPWYNADFDGDAMHVIILTSAATGNEIKQMGGVENWFISYKDSAATIGQESDSLIGTFELTRDTVKFDKYHAMMLFNNTTITPTFDSKSYTGRDIISKILEYTPINFKKVSGFYNKDYAPFIKYSPSEINILIEQGKMITGTLMKKEIGPGGINGLFHKIHIDYGADKTLEQIYNFQQASISYFYQYGFTVGINDMILDKKHLQQIRSIETNIINEANLITENLNRGEIIPPIGKTTDMFYEEQQKNVLRVLDDFNEPILQSMNINNNNLFKLILSGSKGKMTNLCAIVGAIGQITINDSRIDKKFGYERSLAYYQRFDTTPESRGYIANSYISGLTSSEFVFNSQAARFDLISKALSTSITGEKNREAVKNLESIIIDNFRVCRKDRAVVQLCYGEDNIDPRKVIKVKIKGMFMSDKEFEDTYKWKGTKSSIIDDEFKIISTNRKKYRQTFLDIENISFKELASDEKFMPVDITKLYDDALVRLKLLTGKDLKLASQKEIEAMIVKINDFIANTPYLLYNVIQEKKKMELLSYTKRSFTLFNLYIRSVLYSNSLAKINMEILDNILVEISTLYKLALVEYGSCMGIIAAQSFSEPLTQYMLDAHKRSAEGGTSKNDVVKLKEILGAKPMEKASSKMLLRLKPEFQCNKDKVQEVANHIEMMSLDQFKESCLIFVENIHAIIHPEFKHEQAFIKEFLKFNPLQKIPNDITNICIRFELNKTKMILKNMPLELIIGRLQEDFPYTFIVYTPENAKNIIVRIYLTTNSFKDVINEKEIIAIKNEMKSMIIRGINGIINTTLVPLIRNEVKPDGSIVRLIDAWGIETNGSNIYGVATNKYIDPTNIVSDSIDETRKIYGIIAAKYRIVSELRHIGDGLTLNHRHFTLFASEMSYTGEITSISNAGVSAREPHNYLLRMGTSAPIQALETATLKTAVNKITGNTAPLIMGSVPKVGTIYNSFHINEEFIKKNVKNYSTLLDEL